MNMNNILNIDEDQLIELISRLIKTSDKLKGAIFSIVSEIVATKEDIKELTREMDKRFAEMREEINKRFEEIREENNKRFEEINKRFEEINKRFEEINKRFEEMREEINRRFEEMREENNKRFDALQLQINNNYRELKSAIDNLGSRSGVGLEKMVLRLLQEQDRLKEIEFSRIEKVNLIDTEGKIFAPGYSTDIDILMQNGRTILIEIKYKLERNDIGHFLNSSKLYEKIYKKADELWILCLEVAEPTLKFAEKFGIKVIYGNLRKKKK